MQTRFATTALLHVTAKSLATRVVSAVIQNDGASYRIDLLPTLGGADPLPTSTSAAVRKAPDVFEAGCGSPISPTPPYAVIEAAAAAVRHAIGLLVGFPLHPAGEMRNFPTGTERSHQ